MSRDRAVLEVNGVTLLAGLLVVLAVVMGGFTMANPKTVEDVDRAENTPYAVSIDDDRLIIRKQGGDPVTYDQLLVYLSAGETDERLDVDDDASRSQDTDSLFEEGEAAVVNVPWTDPPADRVTVTLVDSVGSEVLYETTVTVDGNAST